MKLKLYNFLVNRQPGIHIRYHRFHDGVGGCRKMLSWLYLLWLNFCYYILCCRFLGRAPRAEIYEQKRLPLRESESVLAAGEHPDVQRTTQLLLQYDVISFDIFDTLLFRPFSEPADLFFFVGAELDYMDFKHIRMQTEQEARQLSLQKYGHAEVAIADIWKLLEAKTGLSAERGMALELSLEQRFCYANPFFLEIVAALKTAGKRILLISDMYLPSEFLQELLKGKGFPGVERIYISCEHKKSKAEGSLYELVKKELPPGSRMIHVGDNPVSDVKHAKEHGLAVCPYPNADRYTKLYRAEDMSPIIGGAYRGVANHFLYNGTQIHGMEYEYGFLYGGLFVLGYCNFIHEYCRQENIDKLLFLARDGDILKQVYDKVFPGEQTEYVYWSRAASASLMAPYDKYDYFRRYLYHKTNKGYTLEQVFKAMGLERLLPYLPSPMIGTTVLTDGNVELLKCFLEKEWDTVLAHCREQQTAAGEYYKAVLSSCKKVCAVDIGWAGSGAMALAYLTEHVWKLPCEVTGLLAGTNTVHNAEPDASEMFLQTGKLKAYLYSRSHNVDLMKKHDPNRDYNVFWELLLSSPTRQFLGFSWESGNVKLHFGNEEENPEGIREIQRGILDFCQEYLRHFGAYPYMLRISGRDAYAPMLAASGHGEEYLKMIAAKFQLRIQVGE